VKTGREARDEEETWKRTDGRRERSEGEGEERVSDRFRSAVRFVSRRARKYRTRVSQEDERLIGG